MINRAAPTKRFAFYIYAGLGYLALWLFTEAVSRPATFGIKLLNHAWLVSYLIVNHYFFFEYTLPYFSRNWKRLAVFVLLLCAHVLCYSLGIYAWRAIGIALHVYTALRVDKSIEEGVTYHLPYVIFSLLFFTAIRFVYHYIRLRQTTQQLVIAQQQAELHYLQSQIHPHFLFNTLNNIYSLAREKSDLAAESILRLSQLLRFVLYETSGGAITIEKELKIVQDYIALEQLRYDSSLHINFTHTIDNLQEQVPPLLLLPLVENAFKHGVSQTSGPAYVTIDLSLQQRQLRYLVNNSVHTTARIATGKNGIGLSNLRRQLELEFRDFQLTVQHDNDAFTSRLYINLASHV